MPDEHPRHELVPALLSPIRLSVVAALAETERADFKALAELVEVAAYALSKNLATLEEAGIVAIEKGRSGRRPRTWVSLTPTGREALRQHLDALAAIAATAVPPATS